MVMQRLLSLKVGGKRHLFLADSINHLGVLPQGHNRSRHGTLDRPIFRPDRPAMTSDEPNDVD
ncbi:hypothetical protein FRC03_011595 [Tulasnella sp. 419]|nr:hypothetical protein FRC03_011595 [Tulasnella sp. 419]